MTDDTNSIGINIGSALPVPQELEIVPEEYYSPGAQQGTLVELYYDTYESKTYEKKTQQLQKRAIVYLPYGYREDQKYNVFYLMHGGGGNETATLGTPDRPSSFKNAVDNAIADGVSPPLIIVCPTYNNTSPEDSGNFSLALELCRNYHNELLNDLIPAVESTYSTHAESTSPEGLMDSRDHRGFGGFSMGSVATWRTFQYGLDYFRYFLPMSCGTSLDEENIFAAAENHDQSDYFVWIITGTEDFAYRYDENRVELMRNAPYFTESIGEQNGNFTYSVKEGYSHGGAAAMEYTYNGLRLFWNTETVQTGQNTGEPYRANAQSEKIKMIIGDVEVTAELDDSEIARQFVSLLPQTISMSRGRDREYYGRIDSTLDYDEVDIQTTAKDGDLAYWFSGNSLAFFFNTENDSAANSGIVVFGKITSDLLVFNDMDGSETMTVTLSE